MEPFRLNPPALPADVEAKYFEQSEGAKRLKSWKYYGTPAYAKYMVSDSDSLLFRRFGGTQVRCLLHLQHSIAVLEAKLEAWDRYGMQELSDLVDCSSFEYDKIPERHAIIVELTRRFQEYNGLLLSFKTVRALPRATPRQILDMQHWHDYYPHAIVESERHELGREDDLFQLVNRTKSLYRIVLRELPFVRVLFRKPHLGSTPPTYWSETVVRTGVTLLVLIAGLGMLLGSCWWLSHIPDDESRLKLITGSTTLFAFEFWIIVGNRPTEILTGTAGYLAILMIYLSH